MMQTRAHIPWLLLACLFLTIRCGSENNPSPGAPSGSTAPAVTLTSVQVGTAGNASTTLVPGETRQLWALAKYSDSTSTDVTNLAVWQSSNPVVATVSNGGMLTAAGEGVADIVATYEKVPGSIHADVRVRGCEGTTISPMDLTYGPFGGSSNTIQVTTPLTTCRWTAQSDVDWLRFQYDPQRSGSGSFSYYVPPNNYAAPRVAHILVSVGGTQIVHTVSQEPPASCSYVVKPEEAYFTTGGGVGSFSVVTTPGDCRWTATSDYTWTVRLTGATAGTGAGTVTYSVTASGYKTDAPIYVGGLSGANPSARYVVHIAGR